MGLIPVPVLARAQAKGFFNPPGALTPQACFCCFKTLPSRVLEYANRIEDGIPKRAPVRTRKPTTRTGAKMTVRKKTLGPHLLAGVF
jgi:hypothetical protein